MGTGDEEIDEARTPRESIGNISFIEAGANHNLAVSTDGSLYGWGENVSGSLGVDLFGNVTKPQMIMTGVTDVASGNNRHAVVTMDNSLYIWLYNGTDLSGDAITNKRQKIMSNTAAVACGENHYMALTKYGALYTWGINYYGQLGNGTDDKSEQPQKIMDNISYITAGSNHCLAITNNGILYAWGLNGSGQIGIETDELIIYTPQKVLENVITASAGDKHTLAVTADGTLYAWGDNYHGQLGNGTNESAKTPQKVMENVVSVDAGGNHSMAVTADGSLYTWGDNEYGQLGDGTTNDSNKPIKIMDDIKLPEGVTLAEQPQTDSEKFSPRRDGWSFRNIAESFGYSDKYYIPKARYEDVYGKAVAKYAKNIKKNKWGGSCYGMSVYASLIKTGIEEWTKTKYVNDYGNLKTIDSENYITIPDSDVIENIERHQISQYSEEIKNHLLTVEEGSGEANRRIFKQIIDDIKYNYTPYIVSVLTPDYGHTMVVDVSRGVEQLNNGWYKIYLYDPNHPYRENAVKMNLQKYNIYYKTWNDRWIKVNVNTGEWCYIHKEKSDKNEYVYNDVKIEYNVSDNISVKMEFEDPAWRKDYKGKNLTMDTSKSIFAASKSMVILNKIGETIVKIKDGVVEFCSDNVYIEPWIDDVADEESKVFSGKIKLNDNELGAVTLDDGSFTFLDEEKVVQVVTDDSVQCDVSGSSVNVTANDKAKVSILAENVIDCDTFDSVTITGEIENGKSVALKNNGNNAYDTETTSKNKFDVNEETQSFEKTTENVDLNKWSSIAAKTPGEDQENTKFNSVVSTWAKDEVEEAYNSNLIPDNLKGKNLSQKISRAEFAAIAVKLYENLSKKNSEAGKTKFTDISSNIYETDIQKAYNLGITNGVSETWFRPLENISREQMAAMLTRAYKKSEFKDWTLKTDSKFPLDTTGISKFDDDEEISDWAKESVYFMNKRQIIKGVDETHFSPKANPNMGEDYGFATREQAIVIALRSFKNL